MKLKKKIIRKYEADQVAAYGDKDGLYNRIVVNMDRLLKMLTGHSNAIDSLERKLNLISSKRLKPSIHTLQSAISGEGRTDE